MDPKSYLTPEVMEVVFKAMRLYKRICEYNHEEAERADSDDVVTTGYLLHQAQQTIESLVGFTSSSWLEEVKKKNEHP